MAIILTLGILGMLLVLALAFASNARTDRKAASANASQTQAKLLAESAVQRVIALMQNYDNAMFSHDDSSANKDTRDWIYHLSVYDYFGTETFAWYNNSVYDQINWQYILAGSPNKIIGRIAYVVKPSGGVDPTSFVQDGVNESGYPETRLGVNTYEMNIASLHDPNNTLSNYGAGNTMDVWNGADTTKNFGFVSGSGKLPNGSTWGIETFSVMYDASHVNVPTANRTLMNKWFVETTQKDDEKFWIDHNDTNGDANFTNNSDGEDNVVDAPEELFHRFNLARTDWNDLDNDSAVPSTTPSEAKDNVDVITGDLTPTGGTVTTPIGMWKWTADGSADGTADNKCDGALIPWLANWKDKGTFADKKIRGKQIAANLIDYCDADDIPTSDIVPSTWDATHIPTYTGNEKSPYINEVFCKLISTQSQTVTDSDSNSVNEYKNNYVVKVKLYVETADIYTGSLGPMDVFVTGAISYTYKKSDGSTVTVNVPIPAGAITGLDDLTNANFKVKGQEIYSGTVGDSVAFETATPSMPEITDVTFKITSVKIAWPSPSTVVADFATPDLSADSAASSGSLGASAGTSLEDHYASFSLQVEDPRQNLNGDDWPAANKYAGDNSTNADNIASLKSNNSNSNPSASGKDPETVSTVVGMSTAYIANAPIVSPWELGCIHRGAKWETLNLKMYNMTEATTGGGNAYTETATSKMDGGDANILDQIKMTSDTQVLKKVSFRVEYPNDIIYALLDKIKFGDDYSNIGTAGTSVTGAPVSTVAKAIIGDSPNFFTRACVAQTPELFNGTFASQDTDAKKEELIGKIINLTSVEKSDYFTIIVLAQAIKDVGGDGTDITIYKDLDADGDVTGSVNESTAGWDIDGLDNDGSHSGKYDNFDDFKNDPSVHDPNEDGDGNPESIAARLGRYDQYADEILGEQKILVRIYRDPTTKKIKILHYEYLED